MYTTIKLNLHSAVSSGTILEKAQNSSTLLLLLLLNLKYINEYTRNTLITP